MRFTKNSVPAKKKLTWKKNVHDGRRTDIRERGDTKGRRRVGHSFKLICAAASARAVRSCCVCVCVLCECIYSRGQGVCCGINFFPTESSRDPRAVDFSATGANECPLLGCLCAAVQEHTVAYTCVFVSASHTPVRDCSHACYCNRTWGLRAACVRAAAEWSAQRGDWIVRRQPAAATSASEPTLHLLSWILIYAVQIVRQPNGHISPAKLAERDLDPFYSTWHEHEEHAIHCRVRVMGPIVRLLKCVAQHHTFGSNAKIITIFSLVQ